MELILVVYVLIEQLTDNKSGRRFEKSRQRDISRHLPGFAERRVERAVPLLRDLGRRSLGYQNDNHDTISDLACGFTRA